MLLTSSYAIPPATGDNKIVLPARQTLAGDARPYAGQRNRAFPSASSASRQLAIGLPWSTYGLSGSAIAARHQRERSAPRTRKLTGVTNATDAAAVLASPRSSSVQPDPDEPAAPDVSVNIDLLMDVDDTPDLPAHQAVASHDATRKALLLSARRRLTPVRRTFVQLPRNGAHGANRAGPLARLVEERQHVALDLLLLLLALQPVISEKDPLPGKTWARLLSTSSATRSPATVSRTWAVLEDLNLIRRERGQPVHPLREDGSGTLWTHPGEDRDSVGYFSLPREYWIDGWHERLRMPGKAVLLIILAETNTPGSSIFSLSAEKIAEHYGLSLSTVKRGLQELRDHELLGEHWQKITAPRSATGWTYKAHYWLKSPFSTKYREAARKADKQEISARAKAAAKMDGGARHE
jgi:hypothetical protein